MARTKFGGQKINAGSGQAGPAPIRNGSGHQLRADSGQAIGAAPVASYEFWGQPQGAESGHTPIASKPNGSGHGTGADSGHGTKAAPVIFERGQVKDADRGKKAGVALNPIGGQHLRADSGQRRRAPKPNGGHYSSAGNGHATNAASVVEEGRFRGADSGQFMPALLDNLVAQCRLREDYHRAEKRLVLQIKSVCRRRAGGKGKTADDMFAALTKLPDPETQGLFIALDVLREQRKLYEKGVQLLAKELPCASWIETVPGVNLLSLGLLVAELEPVLGHLEHADSGYQPAARRRQESRARYRLGLALVEGERQRKVKDKDLAERMGYSPRRRSVMWNIGSCMIKASNRANAPYYDIYLRRKEYEMARGIKRGHAHNRAARYMTTKFLRHFLAQWNAGASHFKPEAAKGLPSPHATWGQTRGADSGQLHAAP